MLKGLRRNLLTRPLHRWARGSLPALSATERGAMEAGDTWWDAELFSGAPDWNRLRAMGKQVVGFEYERHPDRARAQAALDAGAFGVGNW